jgi:hypothetical protein
VATPTTIGKREDKLPLERALRALEDVHKSLNEFSKTDTVAKNNVLNAEIKTVRHKARKLRKRATALAGLWDRTFKTHFLDLAWHGRGNMALVRVKPTQADVAIADDIAARASRRSARVTVVGQRPVPRRASRGRPRCRPISDTCRSRRTRVLAADKPRKKQGFLNGRIKRSRDDGLSRGDTGRRSEASTRQCLEAALGFRECLHVLRIEIMPSIVLRSMIIWFAIAALPALGSKQCC